MSNEVKIKFTGDAKDAVQAAEAVATKLQKLVEEERNLKAALGDTNLTSQMSAEQLKALRLAHADAEQAVQKAGGAHFNLSESLATLQPVIAAVTTAVGALAAAYAVAEKNAAGMAQEEAFANLGGDADEIARTLGGLVDTGDAVAVAQMAKGLGLTTDQMLRLAAASRDVARVTGTTTREAFEALTKSVGMGTTEQLKGIMAKDAMIKAEQALARQLDVSIDKVTTREKVDARMAAAERAIASVRGAATGAAAANADAYERTTTALKELAGVMEDKATTGMVDIAVAISDVAVALRDAITLVDRLADAWNNSAWGAGLAKVDAILEKLQLLLNPFKQLIAFAEVNADQFEGMFGKRPGEFFSGAVEQIAAGGADDGPLTTNAMVATVTALQPHRDTQAEAKAKAEAEARRKAMQWDGVQAALDLEEKAINWLAKMREEANAHRIDNERKAAAAEAEVQRALNADLKALRDKEAADALEETKWLASEFARLREEEATAELAAREKVIAARMPTEGQSAAMQSVGGAILGGSFDVGVLGNAIGLAAGGPMGGQIADAVMSALEGVVGAVVQTITAIVGDARFGKAVEGVASSIGGALTASLVGAIVALPAVIGGLVLGPWIALVAALTAVVWVPVLAITAGILAIASLWIGLGVFLASIPAIAVFMPLFASQLVTSTQSFGRFQSAMSAVVDRMVVALEPFFEGMMWLVGVFDAVAGIFVPFFEAFANSAGLTTMLFDMIKGMVVAFGYASLGAAYLTNLMIGLAMVIGPLVGLSEEQTAAIGASTVNIRRLQEAIQDASAMTIDSATRRGEELAPDEGPPGPGGGGFDGEAGAMTGGEGVKMVNVPSGFKALNAIYAAAEAEDRSGGSAGSSLDYNRGDIVINIDNWNSRGDAQRDFDDLKRLARFGHKGPRGTSRRFGDNKN